MSSSPACRQRPWPRRCLKLLAAFLLLIAGTLLLSRLLLYPHSFPGTFDRIHHGMTETQALQILGPALKPPSRPEGATPNAHRVARTRVYRQKGGLEDAEAHVGEQAREAAIQLEDDYTWGVRFKQGVTAPHPRLVFDPSWNMEPVTLLKWESDQARIYLELDEKRRVAVRHWVELSNASSVWQKLRAWLGWQ